MANSYDPRVFGGDQKLSDQDKAIRLLLNEYLAINRGAQNRARDNIDLLKKGREIAADEKERLKEHIQVTPDEIKAYQLVEQKKSPGKPLLSETTVKQILQNEKLKSPNSQNILIQAIQSDFQKKYKDCKDHTEKYISACGNENILKTLKKEITPQAEACKALLNDLETKERELILKHFGDFIFRDQKDGLENPKLSDKERHEIIEDIMLNIDEYGYPSDDKTIEKALHDYEKTINYTTEARKLCSQLLTTLSSILAENNIDRLTTPVEDYIGSHWLRELSERGEAASNLFKEVEKVVKEVEKVAIQDPKAKAELQELVGRTTTLQTLVGTIIDTIEAAEKVRQAHDEHSKNAEAGVHQNRQPGK